MHKQKLNWTILEIVEIGLLTAVLFVQEQVLSGLPNVQLTLFLIVLFSKTFGVKKASIIVILHVILDNLVNSSFSLFYFPPMMVGWLIIPLTVDTVFRKVNSPLGLAILGIFFSLFYSWLFVIPKVLITKVSAISYFASDIPFEISLAVSSFLTILWLYVPMKKVLEYCETSMKYRYK